MVIGEVAQAHDGSLGAAHAFIDAIATAGGDAVKFQTHIAEAESTPAEPWRIRFSYQDATRYDYWKRMQFTEEQWLGLKHHADERGLLFLSSPFSIEAMELLQRIGVTAWKVASGELSNLAMLERMAATGLPVLISSGLSPLAEIDRAVTLCISRGVTPTVMQCTSAYPCPPEKVGLNMIPLFRARYRCPVGLSDHSGTIYPGLAAAALGIDVLEVHVTLSAEMFGPDVSASVTTSGLRELVRGVRFIETMRMHPVEKDALAEQMEPLRALFTKSVACRIDLPRGTILRREHLTVKKPGTGIPPARLDDLPGLRLCRTVRADELLSENDLERV
ncbi:MAG: N-acetylneuraminate synthase [Luteitalea sp.]|nr:N-acetylneuraminate synthase [Luteitalea sp.]